MWTVHISLFTSAVASYNHAPTNNLIGLLRTVVCSWLCFCACTVTVAGFCGGILALYQERLLYEKVIHTCKVCVPRGRLKELINWKLPSGPERERNELSVWYSSCVCVCEVHPAGKNKEPNVQSTAQCVSWRMCTKKTLLCLTSSAAQLEVSVFFYTFLYTQTVMSCSLLTVKYSASEMNWWIVLNKSWPHINIWRPQNI